MGRVRKIIKDNGSIEEIHKIVVHTFKVGDAEDPDIYAAQPLWEWEKSDKGQWVMEHAIEPPVWSRDLDWDTYGYRYAITVELSGPRATEYYLKWGT
jgi:hypothetical protein